MRSCLFMIILFGTLQVQADVCTHSWWETATLDDLEREAENGFPQICDVRQNTPLHFASSSAQDADVMIAFMGMTEADPLTRNDLDETPLFLAQSRINSAEASARQAEVTFVEALHTHFEAQKSGSLRHLRRELSQAAMQARQERDQAQNQLLVAQSIHAILSASTQ